MNSLKKQKELLLPTYLYSLRKYLPCGYPPTVFAYLLTKMTVIRFLPKGLNVLLFAKIKKVRFIPISEVYLTYFLLLREIPVVFRDTLVPAPYQHFIIIMRRS